MLKWIKETDAKTKWFYAQYVMYGLIILLSTLYAYLYTDFSRTRPPKATQIQESS